MTDSTQFRSVEFTALEFDSNRFGILLSKIVKPRDRNHDEIEPPIGKILRKNIPIRHYFVMPRN